MPYDPPLQEAIEKAGGVSALARRLGIVPSAITQWSRVPTRRARAVEEVTGVPRHRLRPDIWDAPPAPVPTPQPKGKAA